MKTILICGAFWDYERIIDNSKKIIDNAANSFSLKLIKGFKQILEKDLIIINCPFIGSFPKYYKKIYYKGFIDKKENLYNVGFINIIYIRNIFRYYGIKKYLLKCIPNLLDLRYSME